MDQHISRFDADTDNPSQQPNHGVWPRRRLLLQSVLTNLLDLPDLANDETQTLQIALQLRQYSWRQRRALRGVYGCKTLRRHPPSRGQARAGLV